MEKWLRTCLLAKIKELLWNNQNKLLDVGRSKFIDMKNNRKIVLGKKQCRAYDAGGFCRYLARNERDNGVSVAKNDHYDVGRRK